MKDFTELNLGEYMSCCYRVIFPWYLQVGNELDTRWSEGYLRGEKIASKRNRTKCLQSGRTGRILSRWDVQGQLTIHPYIFHQPLGHHCRRQLWTLQDNVCFSEIFFSFPFLLHFLFLWRQVLMSTSVLEISNRFLEIINSFFIQQTCTEWLMDEVGRSWFIQIVKLEGNKITPWEISLEGNSVLSILDLIHFLLLQMLWWLIQFQISNQSIQSQMLHDCI